MRGPLGEKSPSGSGDGSIFYWNCLHGRSVLLKVVDPWQLPRQNVQMLSLWVPSHGMVSPDNVCSCVLTASDETSP